MAVNPIVETRASGSGGMIAMLAGIEPVPDPQEDAVVTGKAGTGRYLSIYPSAAGFDLVEELDFLASRSVEPNVFFNPRFLAPAMPRLDDREVRLAVIRDGDAGRSRLRLLMPYSIEKPAISLGVKVMRTWSNHFGPLGTPLLDGDDPAGVLRDFLTLLGRAEMRLPGVLVMPDIRLQGPVAGLLHLAALELQLPIHTVTPCSRAFLQSPLEGDDYLRRSLSAHHFREFRRLKRRLGDGGALEHSVARQAEEIRLALERFLTLEASGWKGKSGTAMIVDRLQAAFAREAVHRLAQRDMCRIHELRLDGRVIASIVVFVEAGFAYTWKTAFDERYSAFSPGTLLMIEVTRQHLADPNIDATDSCAVEGHPVMDRLWSERREMGTLVIGLRPGADRAARQAAKQFHLYRQTRDLARKVRDRIRTIVRRG